MSQLNITTITKAGEIQVRETKRGKAFWGWNWQRQKMVYFGTFDGQTFEKEANLYRKFDTFNCTQSEYGKLQEVGAGFIRIQPKDTPGTYSISLQDFDKHKIPVHDPGYGPQWGVERRYWSFTPKREKRNKIADNPPVPVIRDIIQERRERQMSLFG
jgi:hypothetical protein